MWGLLQQVTEKVQSVSTDVQRAADGFQDALRGVAASANSTANEEDRRYQRGTSPEELEQAQSRVEALASQISSWKQNFLETHRRAATLDDLDSDPSMGPIWSEYRRLKERLEREAAQRQRAEQEGNDVEIIAEQVSTVVRSSWSWSVTAMAQAADTVRGAVSELPQREAASAFFQTMISGRPKPRVAVPPPDMDAIAAIVFLSQQLCEIEEALDNADTDFQLFVLKSLDEQVSTAEDVLGSLEEMHDQAEVDMEEIYRLLENSAHDDHADATAMISKATSTIAGLRSHLNASLREWTLYMSKIKLGDFSVVAIHSSHVVEAFLRANDQYIAQTFRTNHSSHHAITEKSSPMKPTASTEELVDVTVSVKTPTPAKRTTHADPTASEVIPVLQEQQQQQQKPAPRPKRVRPPPKSIDEKYVISRWEDRTFVRQPGEIAGQALCIDILKRCKIYILDHIDSMNVDECEDCEFIVGPTSNSIFLRDCKNCVVTSVCKQMRLRSCENVDLRLFAQTDPVVESCTGILFRPFNMRLPQLSTLMANSGLNPALNRYVFVYDFTSEDSLPQPHFTVRHVDHGLDVCEFGSEYGTPELPEEMLGLLRGEVAVAESCEGRQASCDIRTTTAAAAVATDEAPVVIAETEETESAERCAIAEEASAKLTCAHEMHGVVAEERSVRTEREAELEHHSAHLRAEMHTVLSEARARDAV
eukprot:PhM_4_TR3760/c0_g1_i1/m.59349/K18272/RP2; protein XRP2